MGDDLQTNAGIGSQFPPVPPASAVGSLQNSSTISPFTYPYIADNIMAKTTIAFGVALIVLGLVAYFGTDPAPAAPASTDGSAEVAAAGGRSITALIPTFFGIPLLICGLVATNEKMLKHGMHGAAMVGLLGALGGLGKGIQGLVTGGNQRAMTFSLIMGLICAVFVFLCVKSFIAARKRREAAEGGTAAEK